MYPKILTGVGLVLMVTSPVFGADTDNGKAISERWCSECHVVSVEQASGSADVPSFKMIAETREGDTLKGFLADPHPKMPDLGLSTRDIDDIIAYITSLK